MAIKIWNGGLGDWSSNNWNDGSPPAPGDFAVIFSNSFVNAYQVFIDYEAILLDRQSTGVVELGFPVIHPGVGTTVTSIGDAGPTSMILRNTQLFGTVQAEIGDLNRIDPASSGVNYGADRCIELPGSNAG